MPAARPGKSTKWKIFICRPKKQQSILQAWRIVHDERSKPTSLLPQTNSRARWAREENSSLAGRWKRKRERERERELGQVRLDQWRGTAGFRGKGGVPPASTAPSSIDRPSLGHKHDCMPRDPRRILLYVGRFQSEEQGKKETRPRNRIRPRRRRS
jgi:hypothetical protein